MKAIASSIVWTLSSPRVPRALRTRPSAASPALPWRSGCWMAKKGLFLTRSCAASIRSSNASPEGKRATCRRRFSTSCFIRAGASAHSAGVIVAMGSNMRRTKASGPPSARACSKAAESRFSTRAKDAAGRSMNASGFRLKELHRTEDPAECSTMGSGNATKVKLGRAHDGQSVRRPRERGNRIHPRNGSDRPRHPAT